MFEIKENKKNDNISKSVDYSDFITEPGNSNAFNLRPREKSKELAGEFNRNFRKKNSLQRVYDQARENSLKANFENFIDQNPNKIKSGREILPELHDKTHFKGASTLLTYQKEIDDIQSNARLRSRFESLKKSISGSSSFSSQSHSIDLGHNPSLSYLHPLNKNSSSLDPPKKPTSTSHPKILNLSPSEISDYGLQRGRITSCNNLKRKKCSIPKPAYHKTNIMKEDNREGQYSRDSRISVSKKLYDSTQGEEGEAMDIPMIARHVLQRCGVVRRAGER